MAMAILRQIYGNDLSDVDTAHATAALKFFDLQNPEEFGVVGVMQKLGLIKVSKDGWKIKKTEFLMAATSMRLRFLM